ncbi:uncharacterized protein LOC132813754 [Hemiscyllium ocellatum]|uniref:uncharacterized protein LOC132813754 n=1 Tax=Hemiscyllium ocellatum TaxID=170820 RepID=UPI002965F2B5|nr:uncharacterized protein LOC132813754 [Hemiscyllium ocellatum]
MTQRHGAAFSGSGCDRLQRAALRAGVWEPRWEKGAERIYKCGIQILREFVTQETCQLLVGKTIGQPESQRSGRSGAFNKSCRQLLATNGHKPIKGESDGEPDRAVSGCIKQDGVDITHGDEVQEIKLFQINNGNVSQDQVKDNDQEIRRCHGPQVSVLPVWIQDWLASRRQQVVAEGKYSAWKSVNPSSVETSPSAQQVNTNFPKSNLPSYLTVTTD